MQRCPCLWISDKFCEWTDTSRGKIKRTILNHLRRRWVSLCILVPNDNVRASIISRTTFILTADCWSSSSDMRVPQEIAGIIIQHDPTTLRNLCLVSTSFLPKAQRVLYCKTRIIVYFDSNDWYRDWFIDLNQAIKLLKTGNEVGWERRIAGKLIWVKVDTLFLIIWGPTGCTRSSTSTDWWA